MPTERESTFASRTEALKHQKRMQTIESQKEQLPVTLVDRDEASTADKTDKSQAPSRNISDGSDNAAGVSVNESDGKENDPQLLPLNKRLAILRAEVIQGLLNGTGPLFPLGLLSVTESERRGDAVQMFARAEELGLGPEKVRTLTTGFQPGDWTLALEDVDQRTVVILKSKN